jgi:hypothetical protein
MLAIADDKSQDNIIGEDGKLICNTEHINRARLRIDLFKWLACKLVPRVYGDSVKHESILTLKHEDAIKLLE